MPLAPLSEQASSVQSTIVKIGMLGLGTVGSGVYKLFQSKPQFQFQQIAVRKLGKERALPDFDPKLLVDDPFLIVRDPSIQLVVELMGGCEPALSLVSEAIKNGKHVVTANKELIAKHGPALFELARKHGVRLLFEGAVAGGIPIIMPLKLSLGANRIERIAGILNGTTNYILTKMSQEGLTFDEALSQAQASGFAEADPTNDVEGFDVAYKISVLALIAFKREVDSSQIYREGITKITALDIAHAKELGYVIKLIGWAQMDEGGCLDIRVHPMLVSATHPLANINNEFNAVFVKGDAVDDVMFYGRGAGEMPTASAVGGDILAIGSGLLQNSDPIPSMIIEPAEPAELKPMSETLNRYYLRLNTHDRPKVIGHLGMACGDAGVSLESVMQKCTNADGTASIILVTHEVNEAAMQRAVELIRQLESTADVSCLLRIF
jgi:homoserine dehydrogenase